MRHDFLMVCKLNSMNEWKCFYLVWLCSAQGTKVGHFYRWKNLILASISLKGSKHLTENLLHSQQAALGFKFLWSCILIDDSESNRLHHSRWLTLVWHVVPESLASSFRIWSFLLRSWAGRSSLELLPSDALRPTNSIQVMKHIHQSFLFYTQQSWSWDVQSISVASCHFWGRKYHSTGYFPNMSITWHLRCSLIRLFCCRLVR